MGIREKLNDNPPLAIAVAIGIALIALIFCIWFMMGGDDVVGPYTGATFWYYDTNTKKLFPAAREATPPIAAPSDAGKDTKSGVRAWVYSCSSCSDASSQFIGYMITYKKGKLPAGSPPDAKAPIVRMVKILKNEKWEVLPNEGPESYKHNKALSKYCGEKTLDQCFPE